MSRAMPERASSARGPKIAARVVAANRAEAMTGCAKCVINPNQSWCAQKKYKGTAAAPISAASFAG